MDFIRSTIAIFSTPKRNKFFFTITIFFFLRDILIFKLLAVEIIKLLIKVIAPGLNILHAINPYDHNLF